jgi:hypothetical protein
VIYYNEKGASQADKEVGFTKRQARTCRAVTKEEVLVVFTYCYEKGMGPGR